MRECVLNQIPFCEGASPRRHHNADAFEDEVTLAQGLHWGTVLGAELDMFHKITLLWSEDTTVGPLSRHVSKSHSGWMARSGHGCCSAVGYFILC
jgi:hypothetical protein